MSSCKSHRFWKVGILPWILMIFLFNSCIFTKRMLFNVQKRCLRINWRKINHVNASIFFLVFLTHSKSLAKCYSWFCLLLCLPQNQKPRVWLTYFPFWTSNSRINGDIWPQWYVGVIWCNWSPFLSLLWKNISKTWCFLRLELKFIIMAQRYITDSYLKCLMIQKSFICCMCELNPSQCHRTNNNVSPIPET